MAPLLLLDNGTLIAAQTPGERWHEDAAALVEAGRAGAADLVVGVGIDYDLETGPVERRAGRRAWLLARPFIRWVPGPFIIGVSRLDWGDVLLSDAQAVVVDGLAGVIGTPPQEPLDRWRRKQIDRHHVSAAYLAGAIAIVTTDADDLLGKRDAVLAVCGVDVVDPGQTLALVDG